MAQEVQEERKRQWHRMGEMGSWHPSSPGVVLWGRPEGEVRELQHATVP